MLLLFGGLIYVAIEEGDRFSHYAVNAQNIVQGNPFTMFLQFIQDNLHHPLTTLLIQIIAVLLMVRLFGYLFSLIGQPGVIGEIVADEDGGKQLIVFFSHCQHPGGRGVAVLGAAFQADLIQGRKCGLGCGEKGGECHQYYQRYPERHTAIVHKKENHTQLSVLICTLSVIAMR